MTNEPEESQDTENTQSNEENEEPQQRRQKVGKEKSTSRTRQGKKKSSSKLAIFAFIFSVIAIFISGITLYLTHFLPFSLEVNFGGLVFWPDTDDTKTQIDLKIGVPILFYNSGAKAGFIEDIAMTIEPEDQEGTKVIYYPWVYFDMEDLISRIFKREPYAFAIRESFSGIYIKSEESVYKELIFAPHRTKIPPQWMPGKYIFTFFVKKEGKEVEATSTRVINLSQKNINKITNKTIFILQPFEWRKDFDIEQGVK